MFMQCYFWKVDFLLFDASFVLYSVLLSDAMGVTLQLFLFFNMNNASSVFCTFIGILIFSVMFSLDAVLSNTSYC